MEIVKSVDLDLNILVFDKFIIITMNIINLEDDSIILLKSRNSKKSFVNFFKLIKYDIFWKKDKKIDLIKMKSISELMYNEIRESIDLYRNS